MLQEQQVLRSAHDELPVALSVLVDGLLDICEQVGGLLYLVEDHRRLVKPQEGSGVGRRQLARIGRLE